MKRPVRSKSSSLLLPLLLALPLSAGASPSGTAPEAKCGAIVNRAFSQAQSPITRGAIKHIKETCNGTSAAEIGPDMDERLDKVAERANEAIDRIGGIFFCDSDQQPSLPLTRQSFIFFSTSEEFLNTSITPFCDGV